jgi:hypothetical protein
MAMALSDAIRVNAILVGNEESPNLKPALASIFYLSPKSLLNPDLLFGLPS